jgi:hypothetical protein
MMRRLIVLACVGTGCLFAQLQLYYVQGTYQAQITVPQYSFGTVSAGDSRDVQFSLMNNGTAPTPLTMLTVGAPFSILYGPSLPQTVPVGDAVSFTVSFFSNSNCRGIFQRHTGCGRRVSGGGGDGELSRSDFGG